MFDAVRIEGAFRNFFGGRPRDHLFDADVFRGGDPKRLGELLEAFSKRFAITALLDRMEGKTPPP